MADIVSTAQGFLPSGSTLATVGIWAGSIAVIGIIIGVGLWMWVDSRRWGRKIPISVEENGGLREIGMDKARVIKVDKGLAEIWFLKKKKMPVSPMIFTSKILTYPCIQKADGELVNYKPTLSADGRVMIAKIIPTNMRMANANIRRYFREIYKHESFMQKWGGMIMFTGAIVVISLVFIYILSEVAKIVPPLQNVANTLNQALSQVHCTPVAPAGQTVTST